MDLKPHARVLWFLGENPESAVSEKASLMERIMKLKDADAMNARKRNLVMLLEFTKICPFRWMRNLYLCFYCNARFPDPALLREHNLIQHPSQSSSQIKHMLSKLKKHEFLKADIAELGCKLCNDQFTDLNNLKLHLLTEHNKNIDPIADDGVLPFKVTKDNFKCVLCEANYDEYKSLNQHMNVHFRNFICHQCGTGFVTPDRLKKHAFTHETGSFACEDCNKTFRSEYAKKNHYDTVHMKVRRHRCTQCPESFRNYFQRNKHLSSVHGVKLKEFKCPMCPKVFNLCGNLTTHISFRHLQKRNHACSQCDMKFFKKHDLDEHLITHAGTKKYECEICKKFYTRLKTLREHMKIHNNDRRFVCPDCGQSFIQRYSLKQHLRVHHPNIIQDINNISL